jgi:hypothetical protein
MNVNAPQALTITWQKIAQGSPKQAAQYATQWILTNAKIEKLTKGLAALGVGCALATLIGYKIAVISAFPAALGIITAIALIALGYQLLSHSFYSNKAYIPTNQDLTNLLPDELLLHIFKQLPKRDAFTASLVCRKWNFVASDDAIWEPFKNDFKSCFVGAGAFTRMDFVFLSYPLLVNFRTNKYRVIQLFQESDTQVYISPDENIILSRAVTGIHFHNQQVSPPKIVPSKGTESLEFSKDSKKIIEVRRFNDEETTFEIVIRNAEGDPIHAFKTVKGLASTFVYKVSPFADKICVRENLSTNEIVVYDIDNSHNKLSLDPQLSDKEYSLVDAAFSYDGKRIVFLFTHCADENDNIIQLWDLETGSKLTEKVFASTKIKCLAFSSDGKLLACVGYHEDRCTIYLLDQNLNLFSSIKSNLWEEVNAAYSIEFLYNDLIVRVSSDQTHHLFCVASGNLLLAYQGKFTGGGKVLLHTTDNGQLECRSYTTRQS